MGWLATLKIGTRAKRLHDELERGATDYDLRQRTGTTAHALYRSQVYWTRVVIAAASLVEVLPLPLRWRTAIMNLLNLIQNVYKAPLTTAAGLGIAYLEFLQNGLTFKAAAVAMLGVLLGGTHGGTKDGN